MTDRRIHAAGQWRTLNLIPSQPRARAVLASGRKPVDLDLLMPFDAWPEAVAIKDQGDVGACVSHAVATALEADRCEEGRQVVALSPWFLHAVASGGRDGGISLLLGLDLAGRVGIAPEADVPPGLTAPDGISVVAARDAMKYRVDVPARVGTWDELLTSAATGRLLTVGIRVGDRFDVDPLGVPPVSEGAPNHAVCVGLGVRKTRRWGWLVLFANSWGTTWGFGGFGWLSRHHIEALTYLEAYEVDAHKGGDRTLPIA